MGDKKNNNGPAKNIGSCFIGFGIHQTHFDDNRLYLPRLVCSRLGTLRTEKWIACPWKTSGLILIPFKLWEPFWEFLEHMEGKNQNHLVHMRHSSSRIHHISQKHGPDREYIREYWVFPFGLVTAPPFSDSCCQSCQICAGNYWLEIAPVTGKTPEPLILT